ncbi:MAG: NADH:flavin oxidoreductase [Chitinispirillaceae bacterium]|nr:NADH:flavin oxidoreductase [Chitinispirillaceae bacterium]
MSLFTPASLGPVKVRNRLIRSATYEGLCDRSGVPTGHYVDLYRTLARGGCGTVITGFCFVSLQGRAIQPLQAGIDSDEKIDAFKPVADAVHRYQSRIFMQLAHCGKQTLSRYTHLPVVSATPGAARYFRERPRVLSTTELREIADQFILAAKRAFKAGFDGVQLHAAHGYLLHEFLLPSIGKRKDRYGPDPSTGISLQLLDEILTGIRQTCPRHFAVLIKISGATDSVPFDRVRFTRFIKELSHRELDGIEISYGTMQQALNIFRGESIPLDTILDHDRQYRQSSRCIRFVWKYCAAPFLSIGIRRFTPMYNLEYAAIAREHSALPVISVGGFRSADEMTRALTSGKTGFVAMSRPFVAEPDLAVKLESSSRWRSHCRNCNRCVVATGSELPTVCRYPATGKKG